MSANTTTVAQHPKIRDLFIQCKGPTQESIAVLFVMPLTSFKPNSFKMSIIQPLA